MDGKQDKQRQSKTAKTRKECNDSSTKQKKDETTFIAFSKGANAEYQARREHNWTLYAGSGMKEARVCEVRHRTGVQTTGVPLMVATQKRKGSLPHQDHTTESGHGRTRF